MIEGEREVRWKHIWGTINPAPAFKGVWGGGRELDASLALPIRVSVRVAKKKLKTKKGAGSSSSWFFEPP